MPHRNFVTHLECSYTGESYEAGRVHGLSREGKPLLVRYERLPLGQHARLTLTAISERSVTVDPTLVVADQ